MFGSWENANLIEEIVVRSPKYFNWTTIVFLAFVVFLYWDMYHKKEYKMLIAGISLYAVHWFYEIMNAVIAKITGYPLWACTNDSTSFILLIGVSVELSFMFSIAGMVAYRMLPREGENKMLGIPLDEKGKLLGLSPKWWTVISMSVLFSVIEIFLYWTGKFIWVYPWWGAIPVCITTYVPFFIAAVFVPDAKPKFQKIFLFSLVGLNVLLLAILIPLGVI